MGSRFGWLLVASACLAAEAQPLANGWAAQRKALPGFHQEFEIRRVYRTGRSEQASKSQLTVDAEGDKWRETAVSGSGATIRIWNGGELLRTEDASEFIKEKTDPKSGPPEPQVYDFEFAAWSKAKEVGRHSCGFSVNDHLCALFDIPLKPGRRGAGMTEQGSVRVAVDTETGLIVSRHTVEAIRTDRSSYQRDVIHALKRQSIGPQPGATFQPPPGAREVRRLTEWNAKKMKQDLVGKPAPDLTVTDMQGQPISLAALRGKTVLIDFWTTWCPPCRADAPALERLHRKYGAKDLAIVGVSVSEDRSVVEKYLAAHPKPFPVVLTTENELPRPYQIRVFPTYVIVGQDGTFEAAVEGDRGFGDLKGLLKKSGLDVD